MLSLRSISRALPRSLPRLAARSQPRFLSTVPRTSFLQQTCKATSIPNYAAFSTSRAAREKEGQVDQELSAKIENELQLEREMRDSETLPSSLQDYLDSSSFELHDTPGQEEVVLTRKFGDESLRVSFSIADLNAMDQDPDDFRADPNDPSQDPALYDEDIPEPSAQSGGANSKGAINAGRTKGGNIAVVPEDRVSPADREDLPEEEEPLPAANEDDVDDDEPSFPARVNVMIEKVGKGTLQIETTAQDGEIVIDNVYYFKDAELADAKTAELDWKRRNLYEGPPFGNLDEALQVLLEKYLDERGVNTALAVWVPEYIDFKEQREYLNWLSNVKSFVDA